MICGWEQVTVVVADFPVMLIECVILFTYPHRTVPEDALTAITSPGRMFADSSKRHVASKAHPDISEVS